MQLPLNGGAFRARSIVGNAQRRINLYPEMNREDSPWKFTHYQRPGRRVRAQGPNAAVRGLHRASNGNGYAAIGNNLYFVGANWLLTLLGTFNVAGAGPVRMTDNGTTMLVVDGSGFGYSVNLATNAFAVVVDPTGTFQGANTVDFLDTFTLWNLPGTRQFGSTISGALTFNALYTAGKVSYPDPLIALIVNRRQILLMGKNKSEIWYDAGGASFPFAELPGAYIEHGIFAQYSAAASDINVYWLSQNLQGQGVVLRQRGYETTVISNYAVSYAFEQAIANGANLNDCVGYTYQIDGHVFYALTSASGDFTWVYDESIGDPQLAWHQEAWTDPATRLLHRDRANCCAFLYGQNISGDWSNGALYQMDPNYFMDDVAGVSDPITCVAGFPRIASAPLPNGQVGYVNGHRIQYNSLALDMEVGTGVLDPVSGLGGKVTLSISDDAGRTFNPAPIQTAGAPGEYLAQPLWRKLGMARNRVFEVSYAINGQAALNGAWVDCASLGN